MDRCATGVAVLDRALGGGFPSGNTILLAGASGIGKTTLALQFLCEGARQGEACGFISITEPLSMLRRNLERYSFFRPEFLAPNRLVLMDLRAMAKRMGLDDGIFHPSEHAAMLETIHQICRDLKIKRLVIDSVTAICQWIHDPVRIRDFVFRLGLLLADLGCTTVITSETPPRTFAFSTFGVEEFVSDGIVFLGDVEESGRLHRTLRVVKMRGTAHSRDPYYMQLRRQGVHLSRKRPRGGVKA